MIARIEVLNDAETDFRSFPIAEQVPGGWQSGAQFYADAKVTKVLGEYRPTLRTRAGLFNRKSQNWHTAYSRWYDHRAAGNRIRATIWGWVADRIVRDYPDRESTDAGSGDAS